MEPIEEVTGKYYRYVAFYVKFIKIGKEEKLVFIIQSIKIKLN